MITKEIVENPRQELAVLVITGTSGQSSLTPARPNAVVISTGLQPGSVFVIRSTLPVVAYQINPYEAANVHTNSAVRHSDPAINRHFLEG